MPRKRVPTVQIEPDRWYALGSYDRHICCDCGLTEVADYKIEKGRIFERVRRDERATAEERRLYGIKVTRNG